MSDPRELVNVDVLRALDELERRVDLLEARDRPSWSREVPSDEQLSDGARDRLGLPRRRRLRIHPRQ